MSFVCLHFDFWINQIICMKYGKRCMPLPIYFLNSVQPPIRTRRTREWSGASGTYACFRVGLIYGNRDWKKKCSTPFVNYNVFVACKTATRQPHKIFFTVNNYDKQFSTEIKHKSTYALRTKYCNLSTGLSNGDDTNIELPHILMIWKL